MIIGQTLMALGGYRFSVANGAMDNYNRTSEWRWASQDVIGAAPRLQYIGPGADTMTVAGTIYPHYRGGLNQVDNMRSEAGSGSPLTLVDGTGRYYGEWVIESIQETRSVFMQDGAPRKIEFSLSLRRYA